MNQIFRPLPVHVNYEASRDGVIRHRRLKKSVGWVNKMGDLMFSVCVKNYLVHRTIYEA